MTLRARLETIPPDISGVHPDRQTRDIEVSAESYEQGRREIFEAIPDGWRAMFIQVLRH